MSFKIPFSFKVKFQLESYLAKLLNQGKCSKQKSFPSDGKTFNKWKQILAYLYESGIIAVPRINSHNLDSFFFSFFADTQPLKSKSDGHERKFFHFGSAFYDVEKAISKTIGELLERHSFATYRNKDLISASCKDLRKRSLSFLLPGTLSHFTENQRKDNQKFIFKDNSLFQWVQGKSLFDEKPIFLPAQAVFWNYCAHFAKEPRLLESNTNGIAGMFSFEQAVLAGLCELIQRDAFLIYWLNNSSPFRINLSAIKEESLRRLIKDFESRGFKITILYLRSDFEIPVFTVVLFDPSGYPKITIGAGCDFNAETAIESALSEALVTNHWIKRKARSAGSLQEKSKLFRDCFKENEGKDARLLFWADPENFKKCAFLFNGPEKSLSELENDRLLFKNEKKKLRFLLNILRKKGTGYEPYYYKARNNVLKDLGYSSVRVIVPELVPFYLSDEYKPLAAKRLKKIPEKLGFKPALTVNKWPHPFP